jgi:hypothetical protein
MNTDPGANIDAWGLASLEQQLFFSSKHFLEAFLVGVELALFEVDD